MAESADCISNRELKDDDYIPVAVSPDRIGGGISNRELKELPPPPRTGISLSCISNRELKGGDEGHVAAAVEQASQIEN